MALRQNANEAMTPALCAEATSAMAYTTPDPHVLPPSRAPTALPAAATEHDTRGARHPRIAVLKRRRMEIAVAHPRAGEGAIWDADAKCFQRMRTIPAFGARTLPAQS
jgi:hypothetical protein